MLLALLIIIIQNILKFIKDLLKKKKLKLGILGLAYKIGTPLITNSFSIDLIKSILPYTKNIIGYDPLVNKDIEKIIKSKKFKLSNNIKLKVRRNNNCPIFTNINYKIFSKKIIIDLWRVVKNKDIIKSTNYINFGNSKNRDFKRVK